MWQIPVTLIFLAGKLGRVVLISHRDVITVSAVFNLYLLFLGDIEVEEERLSFPSTKTHFSPFGHPVDRYMFSMYVK